DRLPHRGRLLPYRRHAHVGAHVLPVVAPRLRAHFGRWPRPVPHRPHVVHRLHAARNGGMGTARGRGGGGGNGNGGAQHHPSHPAGGDRRPAQASNRHGRLSQRPHLHRARGRL